MKKTGLILMTAVILMLSGCKDNRNNAYLPDAENDKVFTIVGVENRKHNGQGYSINVPEKSYRYEKDYDDGNLEEKWEYRKRDDVEIKVTTYKNSDEISARSKFLRDNDDYIFEDMAAYPLCGTERDGDTLWFDVHESGGNVYIVSWEYPKNTDESLKNELADIAATFTAEG